MLDDDVSHELTISVAFLVKAVHLVHGDMVHLELTVVATAEDGTVLWIDGNAPNPVSDFANCTKKHSFSVPECHLLITTADGHVVTLREEADVTRIKTKLFIVTELLCLFASLDLEERKLLVPRADDKQIVRGVKFLRAERECPDR